MAHRYERSDVMDRAPLVETRSTRRRSSPAAPVRELPLRLPVIA